MELNEPIYDRKLTEGERAWFGLVFYIVSYDVWAARNQKETLSMAFYNSLKHPIRRWPVILIWVYITAHLFKFLPERYDPLRLPWKAHYVRYKDKIIIVARKR